MPTPGDAAALAEGRSRRLRLPASSGLIEAVNPSAVQIAIDVGTTARQTFDAWGWGAGGPPDIAAITPLAQAHVTQLFTELGTKAMRLIDPIDSTFESKHGAIIDLAVTNGVDRFTLLGFYKSNVYTPTVFANAVDRVLDNLPALSTAGVVIYCSLQNEPDGSGAVSDMTAFLAGVVADAQECRARLNALGRNNVKLLGMEWAKFSQNNLTEYDNYRNASPANLFPSTVAMPAGHCYKGCPTDQDYDQRALLLKGDGVPGLWSGETGNNFMPGSAGKIICGLNHGVVIEMCHGGQNPYGPSSGNYANASIQCLVDPDGTRLPWHGHRRIFSEVLTRGTIMRLCTSSDRPPEFIMSNGTTSSLSVNAANRMLRTFGNANPRINVCCGKRSDGKWIILAANTTDAAATTANPIYDNICYPPATLQPKVTIPELSGFNSVWTARRCSVAGEVTTAANVNMVSGVIRFTLVAGESIALISSLAGGASSLVARWQFNEATGATTVADSAAGLYPGTVAGSPTFVAGHAGNAINLTPTAAPSSQYVDMANPSPPGLVADGYSFSFWIWFDSVAAERALISKINNSSGAGILFEQNGSAFRVFVGQTTPNINVTAGPPVVINTWTHWAVTLDAGTVRLYKNGTALATGSYTASNVSNTATNFTVGRQGGVAARDFDGRIDDVLIYNRVLSAAEITSIFNDTIPS
jgi:hypothetical protein